MLVYRVRKQIVYEYIKQPCHKELGKDFVQLILKSQQVRL